MGGLSVYSWRPALINALSERGVAFTYATARSIESARTIAGGLNLSLPATTPFTHTQALKADRLQAKKSQPLIFMGCAVVVTVGLEPTTPIDVNDVL